MWSRIILYSLISLLLMINFAFAGEKLYISNDKPPTIFNFVLQSEEYKDSCKGTWNSETEMLELKCKNVHLRIHKCGKVEKFEWREINKNEEIQWYRWNYQLNPALNTYDTK